MRSKPMVQLDRQAVLARIHDQQLKLWWVAEQSGIHKTTLRRWLSSQIRRVRKNHLERLAEVLGAPQAELMQAEDDPLSS